jgi:hypothetical protein
VIIPYPIDTTHGEFLIISRHIRLARWAGQTDVRVRSSQIKATPKDVPHSPIIPPVVSLPPPPHLPRRVGGRRLPLASAATAQTSPVKHPTFTVHVRTYPGRRAHAALRARPTISSEDASLDHLQLRRHAAGPPPHPRPARYLRPSVPSHPKFLIAPTCPK